MSSSNLNDRLKRLGKLVASTPPRTEPPRHPKRYHKLTEAVGAELIDSPSGAFCRVCTTYPLDHAHGLARLEDTTTAPTFAHAHFSALETPGDVHLADLLYLDTETTGLGGTGTVPFLVGVGSVQPEGFEIRQYLIPDYSDEAAMLETLLLELAGERTLVTYNGAAFDIPLLRDRFIINRVARDLPPTGHLDLLHPTRRLFKRRIKDCSLTNVERELFGFDRIDDIPGYLIPSVYFEWLSSEDISQLPSVLEHNRLDILSMHFLAAHISRAFQSEGHSLKAGTDLYSLSRVYQRRSRHDTALRICSRLENEYPDMSPDMLLFHSLTLKKVADWPKAVQIWDQLASRDSREAYIANIELAKYYEHHQPDYPRALDHARKAMSLCPNSRHEREQLAKRLARLTAKLDS